MQIHLDYAHLEGQGNSREASISIKILHKPRIFFDEIDGSIHLVSLLGPSLL